MRMRPVLVVLVGALVMSSAARSTEAAARFHLLAGREAAPAGYRGALLARTPGAGLSLRRYLTPQTALAISAGSGSARDGSGVGFTLGVQYFF